MSSAYKGLVSLLAAGLMCAGAQSQQPAQNNHVTPASLAIAYTQGLWPPVDGVATVYYNIDSASDPNATPKINQAIGIFNADFPNIIHWVQWSSSDGADYVDINLSATDTSGVCEANEGYEAMPAQPMTGSTDCTIGTILHEMGHVVGLLHEQQRSDRNTYVSVNYNNVIKGSWSNFLIDTDNEQILAPYDYASVMQYIPFAFTRNGAPVIESIPAGIPLAGYSGVPSQSDGSGVPAQPAYDYSAGDKEAVARLYGAPPTEVTVTSNPIGLGVIVDGTTVTTPQTYSWALWSTHTLNVPLEVQMLSGYVLNSTAPTSATYYYTYGRWNDSTAQSHSIVVEPGDGSPRFPATSPLLTTYSANFIQLVPYSMNIFPSSASGQATGSPQPQTYTGGTGEYFVARQKVTLTATPETGWHFYEFNNAPFWLPGALGANPKSFYVPDTGNAVDTTTEFSDAPVYTVNVVPQSFDSNLYAYVDSEPFSVYTPKNYSTSSTYNYDAGWTPGSMHTLGFDPSGIEKPYSTNSRYNFSHWSGGDTSLTYSITSLPKTGTVYNATVTPEYRPATNFSFPPCGGTATVSPASPTGDGFYPTGQKLSFTATPDANWTFAGWTYDITGTANPATLTANGETLVYANFNTVAAPLTLTGLVPKTVKAGAAGFTLKLVGTGFSPTSVVSVNGQYPTVTYVNEQTLTVPVPAGAVADAGAFEVFVENYPDIPNYMGCAVFGYQTFLVEGIGALTAKPVITPKGGSYSTAQTVSITDAAPNSTIHYTLDGTTPTAKSPVYSEPLTVSVTTTVKARAISTGFRLSATASATYTIKPPDATYVIK